MTIEEKLAKTRAATPEEISKFFESFLESVFETRTWTFDNNGNLIKNYLLKYKKGTVDNMKTPKFILHTTSTFIKDGAYIEDANDILSLIDYFNLTKEKYHFDILTIDGYFDCLELFLEYTGTEYEETIDSMLSEYQRYLLNDFQKMKAKTHLSSLYGLCVTGGDCND